VGDVALPAAKSAQHRLDAVAQTHQADAPDDRQGHATGAPLQVVQLGRGERDALRLGLGCHQPQRVSVRHPGEPDGVGDVDAVAGGDDRLGRVGQLAQEAQQLLVINGLQIVDNQQRALGR
jgi:hypothetical protein